jgi:hypothetical protein
MNADTFSRQIILVSADPRKEFLKKISLSKSFINYEPSIILLFGGEINIKITESLSIREMLFEYCNLHNKLLKKSIKLVEHYKDWYENAHYDNLLTFEEDLIQLASLTVIILESAGAIAELGAFCINEKINQNLVIALSEKHFKEKSFITLGPLKQLEKHAEHAAWIYEWDYSDIENTAKTELPILAKDIEEYVKNQKAKSFDRENIGHLAYLVHELLVQFKALTCKEIISFLNTLDINRNRKEVKKLLYLLELLELIKKRNKGHREYFIAKCKISRVLFSGENPTDRFDDAEIKMSVMRYYIDTENDKIRVKIIAQEYGI